MKSLISCVKKEAKLIFRNGISRYLVLAPVILALIFIMVFGAMRESNLVVAVDNTISASDREKLEQVFDVEEFDSSVKMHARVEAVDSVVGVTDENGKISVIAQGNEDADFIDSMSVKVKTALLAKPIEFTSRAVEGKGDFAFRFCLISVYLLSLFIGGSIVGLTSVSERENGVIHAIAVSPITFPRYIAGKLIPAMLISVVGTVLVTLITGNLQALPSMTLLALASVFVCGMSAFVVPSFAGNQIAAVGVLKLSMPVMLVLPLSSMFVSDKLQVLYYWLPMYWQCRGIQQILSGDKALLSVLLSFFVSLPWFYGVAVLFSKKIRMNRS